MRSHALELARVRLEGDAAERAHLLAEDGIEACGRVEPGSDRRPALRQQAQPRERGLDALDPEGDLLPEGIERLAHGHRHGIHEVRAPDLHHVLEGTRLGGQRLLEQTESRKQAVAEFEHRREMHHRRKAVVRRLRAIDVVVRVDRLARSEGMPQQLVGPVGDHLVGIHVRLGAGSRLPDRQGEVVVEPSLPDLPGRCLDGIRQRGGQGAQVPVRAGGRKLLKAEGADQGRGEALLADLEERQRPLGLRAPVAVGWNLDLAEGIPLDAHLLSGHGMLLGTLGRSA